MESCLNVIILIISVMHIRLTFGAIKVSSSRCDRFINSTYTCYQVHKVGAKATFKINVHDVHEPADIKWFRRVKIRGKTTPLLLSLEDDGKLPRNMFLSHDRCTLEVIKIRNYDTASNSFKVEVKSKENHINFVIDVQPIEFGPQPLGTALVINIEDYIQLPGYASMLHWYLEGAHAKLPSNAKIKDDGKKLTIDHVEYKDYQMYVCVVYSEKNYFLAKRRFQLLRAQHLSKDPPTFPNIVYRPIDSSIRFSVKVYGVSRFSLKWYKDKNLLNSHHSIVMSDNQRQLRIPKIKHGMFGTYTCTLQGKTKNSSISVDFQLKKPVVPFKSKLAHDWNFDVTRSTDGRVEVLDTITGVTSTGDEGVGCLEPAKGVSGDAIVVNMKHKSCNGKMELLKSDAANECVIDPEICYEGFTLSIWLELKIPPISRITDVLCTHPRGLCITCKRSKNSHKVMECVTEIATLDQKWHLTFELRSHHWQFLVITWSPISECRVFVDGEMKVSTLGQSIANPPHATQESFTLGLADNRIKDGTAPLHGLVDEFLVWHQVVLSPKQLATMFLQFHGLDKPNLKEVSYNHTIDAGDNLRLTCPFNLPPVFRSQLQWVVDNREVKEYTGRQTIVVPVDRPQIFTCQYFNGSDVVPSEKFFVSINGYKSVASDSSEHRVDMSQEVEPVEVNDVHHRMIQDDLNQKKDDINVKEYPCLSYPCKNGATCQHRQHVFLINGTQNSAYSYTCQCTDKYRGFNCEQEITSCHSYPCENGKCIDDDNRDTGFHCLCYNGYKGKTCSEDIDECGDVNDCSPHSECINSPGSYSCRCRPGYEGDGKHCIATAVHVTLSDPHMCTSVLKASQLCIIETDQIRTCDITFAVNITGVYKEKDVVWSKHWAKFNNNGPHAIEFKVEPTTFMVTNNATRKGIKCWESDFAENYFKVEVRNGHIPPPSFMFKLVHQSIELGPKIPGTPFELSVYYYGVFPDNTWTGKWVKQASGNFTIVEPPRLTYEYRVEKLKSGDIGFLIYYGYDTDGYQVATRTFHDEQDVDECLESTNTCSLEMSECENLPGSYRCVCHPGYQKEGDNCQDIDECVLKNHCHQSARCENTVGSYTCTCLEGFHGNGIECAEVDCPLLGPFENGRISGLSHSFRSTVLFRCYKGYRLEGSHRLSCKETGIWSALKPSCIDINECELSNYCDSNAICHNEPGDYQCACKRGYEGDGLRCVDIDECSGTVNPCHKHAVCINRDGGFGCTCFHQALSNPSSDCTGSLGYNTEYLSSSDMSDAIPTPFLRNANYEKVNFADLAEILPFMEYEDFNTTIQFPGWKSGPLTEEQFHQGDHVMALEGSSYDIPCIPYSIMNSIVMLDPTFLWIRDHGATLDPTHYKPAENGNLHFTKVSAQDSGPFKCRISYSDISGDSFKRMTYDHQLSVFTTATPLCDISVTYYTEACQHTTNFQHRNAFLSSVAKKVCVHVGCTVLQFEMECHRVQENVGRRYSTVAQLDYEFTLQMNVNIPEISACNVTCVVMHLQSHVGQVLGALDEFVRQEELKAKGNQVYKIMSNSWTHTVRFICREGYAIRDYICVACPPGSSSMGDFCHPCRQGYYQNNFTSSTCEACPHHQITKTIGSTSLDQCYVDKLSEKILGGIIGGGVTLGCIVIVIIYRIVVKHFKGSAQHIAFRRLSEAFEDNMEMAKDTIKNKAEDLAFKAEIAKCEYTDKRKKNTHQKAKSRKMAKRKAKKKEMLSDDTDQETSDDSLLVDSESYQGSNHERESERQRLKKSGSPQKKNSGIHQGSISGSQQGSHQGSHHVHFPANYKKNKTDQHSIHTLSVNGNADKKSEESHRNIDSPNPLIQAWSQHSSHNAHPVNLNSDSRERGPNSLMCLPKNDIYHLEQSNSEYLNVDGFGLNNNDPDTTHTTPMDEYHSSYEVLDSPSSQNLKKVRAHEDASNDEIKKSLAERDEVREQLSLTNMDDEKKSASQVNIKQSLDNRIPIAPPPPPIPRFITEDRNAFGFPPPPPNF